MVVQGTFLSNTTLSDDDDELEVVALVDGVFGRDVPVVDVEDRLGLAMRLPGGDTSRVAALIVLVQNTDGRDIVGETGDDVEPGLVVVDSHGDEEGLLALLGHETEHARGAAASHGELEDAVRLGPGGSIGVVPAALLDDLEEGVGVALVDTDFDAVRHSMGNETVRKRETTRWAYLG